VSAARPPADRERDPGVEAILRERRRPAPVSRKLPGPLSWFDVRSRSTGHLAFSLNRITGLGLVIYLYLHLAVLSQLLGGEDAWNGFLELATTPLFLGLDVLLVFGLLVHGLNGTRLALVGSGFVPNRQKALFWAFMTFGAIVLVYTALHVFGVGE
jgi:succinate dehydrogenase / fumarate reductase, cytochrome b subunit